MAIFLLLFTFSGGLVVLLLRIVSSWGGPFPLVWKIRGGVSSSSGDFDTHRPLDGHQCHIRFELGVMTTSVIGLTRMVKVMNCSGTVKARGDQVAQDGMNVRCFGDATGQKNTFRTESEAFATSFRSSRQHRTVPEP